MPSAPPPTTNSAASVPRRGARSTRSLPYWHHKWRQWGGDTWLYMGAPWARRLTRRQPGILHRQRRRQRAAERLRCAVHGLTYMRPAASPGPTASEEEAWNFTVGLSFYPRRNARTNTVAGQCWMPHDAGRQQRLLPGGHEQPLTADSCSGGGIRGDSETPRIVRRKSHDFRYDIQATARPPGDRPRASGLRPARPVDCAPAIARARRSSRRRRRCRCRGT